MQCAAVLMPALPHIYIDEKCEEGVVGGRKRGARVKDEP
jgi:hypothetical protein